jgi:hypothetical protein
MSTARAGAITRLAASVLLLLVASLLFSTVVGGVDDDEGGRKRPREGENGGEFLWFTCLMYKIDKFKLKIKINK